jgi:formylmethanofuran dehydrogenase subunit C
MSSLVLQLRTALAERIDVSGLVRAAACAGDLGALQRLSVGSGRHPIELGDVFHVSGTPGGAIVLEGSSDRIDGIGAGLDGGTIVVDGDAGSGAGRGMRGGRLEIRGNAGTHLASGLKGGVIVVGGSAGDEVGAAYPGERFGMAGGTVVIGGNIGARAGDRMRRGTIVARGAAGAAAGSRMMGGTIWAQGGFGDGPGPLLRRGTLIGPAASRLLATFADCGEHDLVFLRLLDRHLAATLGDIAPSPLPARVRRLAGDLATIGKGEILLTA